MGDPRPGRTRSATVQGREDRLGRGDPGACPVSWSVRRQRDCAVSGTAPSAGLRRQRDCAVSGTEAGTGVAPRADRFRGRISIGRFGSWMPGPAWSTWSPMSLWWRIAVRAGICGVWCAGAGGELDRAATLTVPGVHAGCPVTDDADGSRPKGQQDPAGPAQDVPIGRMAQRPSQTNWRPSRTSTNYPHGWALLRQHTAKTLTGLLPGRMTPGAWPWFIRARVEVAM